MSRIRVIYYWKHYLTKAHYRYKRYVYYLPKAIGDALDTSIDYDVRLVDKIIVMMPKGLADVETTIARIQSEWDRTKCTDAQPGQSPNQS